MFIKHKKIKSQPLQLKSWFQQIKQKYQILNPLFLTFILTLINIWCFTEFSIIVSSIFLLISFFFLFFRYQKYCWITLFLLIPFLSLIIQNYLFQDWTELNQTLENVTLKVIKKASTYVILQWNHQKFYWSTFDQNFIIGQSLKVNAMVIEISPNTNSFNFDFAQYLRNENVYRALKITNFELIDSQNLKFLIFSWIEKQKFANSIQFFVFQLPSIAPIKKILNELSLGYLLNFSGLNFFLFTFCFNKIWKKFHLTNYWKIPFHCFLIFFVYLLGFPLIFTRVVLGLILKNFFSLFHLRISNLNKNLITLNCLFLINPKFIFQQMAFYLIVAYSFFQKPTNFRDTHYWLTNIFKSIVIFVPLQIFFQYRWNLTAPFLSLLISPLLAGFYLLSFLLWWIPLINNFWTFLEGALLETLTMLQYLSFSWNFGSEPFLIILIYYFLLWWIFYFKKFRKIAISGFCVCTCLLIFYSKIVLPQEAFFMLNVGNGNSFVYLNKWKNLVIIYDCGSGPGFSSTNMADFLKAKGINHVDLMFISHFHDDHFNGIESVKKITNVYNIVTNQSNELNWKIKDVLIVGWKLEKMKDLNDSSLVILIKTGTRNLLLMGDLTTKGEEKLLENFSFVQTLKETSIHLMQLGHHGSKTSSSENFLNFVNPQKIFISAGIKNNHQFPDDEILNRLKKLGLIFFSTHEKINWKYDFLNNQCTSFN